MRMGKGGGKGGGHSAGGPKTGGRDRRGQGGERAAGQGEARNKPFRPKEKSPRSPIANLPVRQWPREEEALLPQRSRQATARDAGMKDTGSRDVASRPLAAPGAKPRLSPEMPDSGQPTIITVAVQNLEIGPDDAEMRIDRFLQNRYPQLPHSYIQRIVRKGEVRLDGKRVETSDRVGPGQVVRIPPLKLGSEPLRNRSESAVDEALEFLKSVTLYEDADVLVINKPAGLAVQGGPGLTRHVDGILGALTTPDGQTPRLVHRLDKDTSGCLVIAKSRLAASVLAKSFRHRSARKVYWALVAGVPRMKQGRVSTYLAKDADREGDSRMVVAQHGDDGAMHAVTYYAVVETSGQKLAWLSMKPVTGRTHQLRAHAAHMGHPIVGDPKYFDVENWQLPGGLQNKLHLVARRIVIPHPRGGDPIDVTAPLPPHMRQSWNLLGLDDARYDPIVDAPEE